MRALRSVEPAHPINERHHDGSHHHTHLGATLREQAALAILAGMGAWTPGNQLLVIHGTVNREALRSRAAFAIAQADELLIELELSQ